MGVVVTTTLVRENLSIADAEIAANRTAPVRAGASTVLGLIAVGAAITVGLWWHDTSGVHGLGDWLTNAGRICGLLAGYGVVVLLVLMARLPPLERGIGADRLARWHAMGGRYTVGLIVAHALLIVWGYAVSAHTTVVSQTKTLLLSYPDVLAGTVAGLLFVGVGISSARAARRRLRYETWYYLHFYTYLAIALAFSHQFSTGAEFMTHRGARVYWAALYIAAAAAILWYRFITPVRQALRHRLRIVAVERETADVVSVIVAGRHLHELGAESGQFFRWRFLAKGLWWTSAPYSLSAPAGADRMRITVKTLGDHSRRIAGLRPGVRVIAEGPYGALMASRRRRDKALLIAGGVGITPLRALFETIPAAPGGLTLVYRASRERDVVFRKELQALARRRGARVRLVIGSRAELGRDPLSADGLQANVPDLANHDVYLCRPPGMTESVIRSLRRARVPRRQIHREAFEF
jgi:predicted ferric reductase